MENQEIKTSTECPGDNIEDPRYYDEGKHLFMASAGSGKTYRLAFEYICLLLKNNEDGNGPKDNYKHILAITFTHKATTEMKERILKNLDMLSKCEDEIVDEKEKKEKKDYEIHLCNRLGYNEVSDLRERARLVYHNLLHDYSNFHISTIDSFFQKVLRNLAREMGLGSYWNVEMDENGILADATQEIMNLVSEDSNLKDWITSFVNSQMEENGSWDIKKSVQEFGKNIFKESFATNEEMQKFLKCGETDEHASIPTEKLKENIKSIRENEASKLAVNKNLIKSSAKEWVDEVNREYPGKSINHYILDHLTKASEGQGMTFGGTEDKVMVPELDKSYDTLFTAGFKKANRLDKMEDFVKKTKNLLTELKKVETENNKYKAILKHINEIGLLGDLIKITRDILNDRNQFIISDTQPLLHHFTENCDAPFIFERIGENIQYIMIDEFQDTSEIQYDNFKPLIENCASSFNSSLIVGDPKQAIYRFRNGDWKLIKKLEADYCTHKMKDNYRSARNVVAFNNMVFAQDPKAGQKSVVNQIDNQLRESQENQKNANLKEFLNYISSIYADGEQNAKSKKEGYVKAIFQGTKSDEDKDDWMNRHIVSTVKELNEQNGIALDDITILVRKNKYIPKIADELSKNGIKVTSNEAFQLKASSRVRLIIDALRYISTLEIPYKSYKKDENGEWVAEEPATKEESANEKLYKQIFLSDYCRHLTEIDGMEGNAGKWEDLVQEKREKIEEICTFIKNNILELPLYDQAEELYRQLFDKEPTDAYVQTLFDKILDFVGKKSSDINKLLEVWENTLSTTNVPVDEKAKAGVRIMSIHKSKGLEAHTILIPYCDWKATSDVHDDIWCKQEEEDNIPLIPCSYKKETGEIFPNEYNEETAQLYIDNLNLLYVALTRAKNNLFIFSSKIKSGTSEASSYGVNDYLYKALSGNEQMQKITQSEEHETKDAEEEKKEGTADEVFVLGTDIYTYNDKEKEERVQEERKQKESEVKLTQDTFSQKGRFRQSSNAKRFILNDEKSTDAIEKGLLYHSIMEQIKTIADPEHPSAEINEAIDNLVYAGNIDINKKESLAKEVTAIVCKQREYTQLWYAPSNTIYNECNILIMDEDGSIKQKRPDHMVYSANTNTYTIVDYKTGVFNNEHNQQVKEYMNIVKQMHPNSKVKGYLWYMLDNNTIKEVKES